MNVKIVEYKCADCGNRAYMNGERAGCKCRRCNGELIPQNTYRMAADGRIDSAQTLPNETRKYTQREAAEQELLFEWASYVSCTCPELDLLFHIPNGGSRNKIEAANLKRQGVKPGVPDLCLPVARGGYHGLYIELKAGDNKPQDNQREWIAKLSAQGYRATVCYGWERAKEEIEKYLGI